MWGRTLACVAAMFLMALPVGASTPVSNADYEYDGGFEGTGVSGRCSGFARAEGSPFGFTSQETFIEIVTTTWQEMVLAPDSPDPVITRLGPPETTTDTVPGIDGPYIVSFAETGTAFVVSPKWPAKSALTTIAFNASLATASPTMVDAFDDSLYVRTPSGSTADRYIALQGWERIVEARNGTIMAEGPQAIIVVGGLIQTTDHTIDVSETRRVREAAGIGPAAIVREVTETYAIVRSGNLTLTAASDAWALSCGPMDFRVNGDLTVFSARGSAADQVFSDRAWSMAGDFRVMEGPPQDWPTTGASPPVQANAQGRFDGLYVDFRAASLLEDPLVTAASVVAAGGLLLAAGILFSRLHRNAIANHPTRAMIIEVVRHSPWIRQIDISRSTGYALSTARHHLSKLVQHGLLVEDQRGGHVRYHVQGRDPSSQGRLRPATTPQSLEYTDPIVSRIIEETVEPVRMTDLAKFLAAEYGYARSGAWYKVHKLTLDGILIDVKNDGGRWVQSA